MKPHLLSMTRGQLRRAVIDAGDKAFRADQLADWVYKKGVTAAEQMSNVPNALVEEFDILSSRVAAESASRDGCTKLLLELHDGRRIETVIIPTDDRATACVSTQAGCAVGCAFCASGMGGLERNLSDAEILEQVVHLHQVSGQAATNVVFMGIGEPLSNYDATVSAVRSLIDPERFGISARRVTVSTVGLPKQIRRLAKEDLPITLAISLHAPNDAIRREIVPLAAKYPLEEVLDAARFFYEARKREITIEYVLLADVNDSLICADALAKITHNLRCNVNVLTYNPVEGLPFERPTNVTIKAFLGRLDQQGVNANLRRSRGLDTDAACGQLRRRTST